MGIFGLRFGEFRGKAWERETYKQSVKSPSSKAGNSFFPELICLLPHKPKPRTVVFPQVGGRG